MICGSFAWIRTAVSFEANLACVSSEVTTSPCSMDYRPHCTGSANSDNISATFFGGVPGGAFYFHRRPGLFNHGRICWLRPAAIHPLLFALTAEPLQLLPETVANPTLATQLSRFAPQAGSKRHTGIYGRVIDESQRPYDGCPHTEPTNRSPQRDCRENTLPNPRPAARRKLSRGLDP